MKPMTRQEIFDKGVKGIREQGGPSIEAGGCKYLSANGRRCAIGWCIPDGHEAFSQSEGSNVDSLMELYEDLGELFEDATEPFLDQFQACHDMASQRPDFFEDFESRIGRLARNYDLTIPEAV